MTWAGPGFFRPIPSTSGARLGADQNDIFLWAGLREQCEQDHELGYQIMKRIAEVATQSLGATQRRLMQYIDKNIPEQPSRS
jgi:hypothetical protein